MKIIETLKAPNPIGPYSQGIVHQGMLYSSGQGPLDPKTNIIPDNIRSQAELTCRNIEAILIAGNSNFSKVIKTTCFLRDMADFKVFNEIYAKYFVSKPARSCIAVKDLPKGFLCEIEVVAISDSIS